MRNSNRRRSTRAQGAKNLCQGCYFVARQTSISEDSVVGTLPTLSNPGALQGLSPAPLAPPQRVDVLVSAAEAPLPGLLWPARAFWLLRPCRGAAREAPVETLHFSRESTDLGEHDENTQQ